MPEGVSPIPLWTQYEPSPGLSYGGNRVFVNCSSLDSKFVKWIPQRIVFRYNLIKR